MAVARRSLSVGLGLAGVACALLGGCLLIVGPLIIRQQVIKNVRINPSSISFQMWKDIPVPFYLSVHFFEVLNHKEVLQGAKPVLNQRGPYVYRAQLLSWSRLNIELHGSVPISRETQNVPNMSALVMGTTMENKEYRYKTNITFHDNDTVSYLEYRNLFFQPDLSSGTEDDYIVVPNILMLGAAAMLETLPGLLKFILSKVLAGLKQEAFMNRTVGEIMWGYDDPLLDMINSVLPDLVPFKGKFGLFVDFNDSNSGLFTVNTGMKNIHQVHMIDSWNGLKKVNYWQSSQCNMINGTAGEMWPPFMSPTSLEFYSPDACRSMTLVYEQSGKFQGVPIYRFVAPKTLFANGTDYPPNEGFCPCMQSGIQNVSTCRFKAPMFISHPHFYNADPSLVNAVEGLHPSKEQHGLFLDVHPMTGIPMNCSIKLQLNLYIKEVSGITQTGNIKPVVLPLLWFAESGSIEGSVLKQFYNNLVLIPSVLDYLQYTFLGLSVLFFISAAVLVVMSKRGAAEKSPRPPRTQSKPPPSSETTPLLHDADALSQDDAEA